MLTFYGRLVAWLVAATIALAAPVAHAATLSEALARFTTDDFSDELFSIADHAWLDSLDEAHARIFAAEQGYDLVDDQGMLTDWWGYCWMILAEKRGLLTPENRAAARAAIEEKYLSAPNVIGVIVGR